MNKKRTLKAQEIREITYSSIALALSILFVSLSYVLPFSSLLMMIFIPILASLVAFNIRFKMQGLYLLAIIVVCFIDIQEGFFYLLPNTLIGLMFGNLIKRKISSFYLFFFTSIFACLINCLSYYPIKMIFGVDMIDTYRAIFNLERNTFIIIYPAFYYLLSAAETFFLLLIATEELKKFKVNINEKTDSNVINIGALILSCLSISLVMIFNFNMYTTFISAISLIPLAYSIILLYSKERSKLTKIFYYSPFIAVVLFCIPIAINIKYIPLSIIFSLSIFPIVNLIDDYYILNKNNKVENSKLISL